jgi:predicted TIM-barrel fold metal-dependent hydrolase
MHSRTAIGAASARTAADDPVPDGACDCHMHVIGNPAQFPFAEDRIYTPPGASIEQLLDLQRELGLARAVIVQPSVYGTDNSCTIDAVRRLGPRARGVAVIDGATPRRALEQMNRAGIRGVRLNVITNNPDGFEPGRARELLDAIAGQIDGLGWHVQIYARTLVIAALARHIGELRFPVVIDHFGHARPDRAPAPGFDALLDLVRSGAVYVKLSGAYRISQQAPDYADMAPIARALVAANPDRILWGTDWPHTNSAYGRGRPLTDTAPPLPIDDGRLMNELWTWAPDAAVRKRILVDNPARLYGFEP